MFETLLTNLTYIGIAMGLLAIAYISNIFFSLFYNIKITKENFDKQKLIDGVLKVIVLCLGTATLSCVVTLLPIFAQYVGITLADEFIDTFNILAIISLFISSIFKYTKEAYDTFKNILNPIEIDNTTVNTDTTENK